MAGESDDLEKLFESVADGESVDWDALERQAPDDESRALIRQLRLIAEVAEVHRSQVDEPTPPDVELTVPAMGGLPPIHPAVARRILPGPSTTLGGGAPPGTTVPPGGVPPDGSDPAPNFGTWGHLLLVRKIGEGSYGEVYQAHDTWLDHPVALKLLKPEAESRVPPAQLLHEARKLARVRHANVVTVHGADRHNGRVGFWMDFIDGDTLATRVSKGRLSAGEATSIGQEVCRALAAVHRANIIHRDVKAQNVMRAHDGGGIILMDFGAGEFVGDETVNPQGTPLYMAPELFQDERASKKSDIYAVGVLLYHLVTNTFPVNGGSMRELREAHARGERRRLRDERPDLPDWFITIVETATDPDPMRRYATAGDMAAKLGDLPVPPPPPVTPPDYLKRILGFVIGLLVLTGAVGFIAARFFEVVVQVDREFSAGMADVFVVGARSMLAVSIIGVFYGAIFGILAALRAVFGASLSKPLAKLRDFLHGCDPLRLAVGIAVVGVFLSGALNFIVFGDLFSAMFALAADPATTADLSILTPLRQRIHTEQAVLAASLSMLLAVIGWYCFPPLERRAKDPSTIQILKWGTVAVAFITLALFAAPRRILWERFPVATFDNRIGFVIGTVGNESLVYVPSEPGRPRVRRRADSLERTGETRFLFDPNVRR
jgi:serine/threonine-protein kinase